MPDPAGKNHVPSHMASIRPFPTDQKMARCLHEKRKNMQLKAGSERPGSKVDSGVVYL